MKKVSATMLWAFVLAFHYAANAQDIWINRFETNNTSLIARMNQIHDNTGNACAVLRCYVRGNDYRIEPNLGVVKDSIIDGEIRIWVSEGIRRLTIRHKDLKPLIGYTIPIRLEKLKDYDVDVESIIESHMNGNTNNVNENNIVKRKVKNHPFYLGAGFNAMSISGPSLNMGINIKHHTLEIEGVLGLNKTGLINNFEYRANRVGFRYEEKGLDLKEHMVEIDEMAKLGAGTTRQVKSMGLSRTACLTIASNADQKKLLVKAAKEYFTEGMTSKELATSVEGNV